MTLTDKIKELIATHRLTPSHFADEIGVQRSIISHILSGRNRPSLDIVQRVVNRFPEVTYEWLLDDNGTISGEEGNSSTMEDSLVSAKVAPPAKLRSTFKKHQEEENGHDLVSVKSSKAGPSSMPDRTIERILIFYNDNTYTEYMPAIKNVNNN